MASCTYTILEKDSNILRRYTTATASTSHRLSAAAAEGVAEEYQKRSSKHISCVSENSSKILF